MVLVDTSVWIEHLRRKNAALVDLLENEQTVCHPFIIGELACGNLKNRTELLNLLQALPGCIEASHEEALEFIYARNLMGKGLGYIDIHLLASAVLTGIPIWTFDKKLKSCSIQLQISFE
jgi:predicted nucleic acid-binding protein